jgi:RimJ/RimL family protein N-acetyltransferase
MHSVQLMVFSYNKRAVRLYEKLGFVHEGRIRESLYYDFKWHDKIHYSMLDREWMALRGRTEVEE